MNRKGVRILIGAALLMVLASLSFSTDFTYTNDHVALALMNRLAQRLTSASGLKISYRLYIEHYAQVNAYSAPDGRIIVTQGLLRSITTEEEVAAAIAHEMGHLIVGMKPKSIRGFTMVGNGEFTADKLGIQTLEKAGINPLCLASMLETVLQSDGAVLPKSQVRQINDRIHKIEKTAAHYNPPAGVVVAGGV
jgi:predicted Zn-dependent protease